MTNFYQYGSWAFFGGCCAFSWDLIKLCKTTKPSIHVIVGTSLFQFGSVMFLQDSYNVSK